MNRRNFITGLGATLAAGLAGCTQFGGSQDETETITKTEVPYTKVNESEAPAHVREAKDGAGALLRKMVNAEYKNARVNIISEGGLVASYTSEAPIGKRIKEELYDLAAMYGAVAAEHEGVGNLTIVANGLRANVAKTPAVKYANGELKENAFHETISITTNGETDA